MKTLAVAYVFLLGYLAKKYEIPARAATAILDGVDAISRTAGHAFASGMTLPDLERDPGYIEELLEENRAPRFSEPLKPGE